MIGLTLFLVMNVAWSKSATDCDKYSGCQACILSGCGWCQTPGNGVCLQGSDTGPVSGNIFFLFISIFNIDVNLTSSGTCPIDKWSTGSCPAISDGAYYHGLWIALFFLYGLLSILVTVQV